MLIKLIFQITNSVKWLKFLFSSSCYWHFKFVLVVSDGYLQGSKLT